MGTVLKFLGCIALGAALGLGATWAAMTQGGLWNEVENGPWRTSLAIGNAASDPYTRAYVAIHGLLALNRSETVYYFADRDEAGAALDGRCRYRVAGTDPDARWWSVTAYAGDNFLIPNDARRYSISKNSALRGADGSFVIEVANTAAPANWIPVARAPFSLTLRLYNPGASVLEDPAATKLPRIVKGPCA